MAALPDAENAALEAFVARSEWGASAADSLQKALLSAAPASAVRSGVLASRLAASHASGTVCAAAADRTRALATTDETLAAAASERGRLAGLRVQVADARKTRARREKAVALARLVASQPRPEESEAGIRAVQAETGALRRRAARLDVRRARLAADTALLLKCVDDLEGVAEERGAMEGAEEEDGEVMDADVEEMVDTDAVMTTE